MFELDWHRDPNTEGLLFIAFGHNNEISYGITYNLFTGARLSVVTNGKTELFPETWTGANALADAKQFAGFIETRRRQGLPIGNWTKHD